MKNNKGTAIVEFAFVLPILIILVFGIIEFGLLIYNKAMITNASREGARIGIVYRVDVDNDYVPPDDPGVQSLIETRITEYLSTHLISFDPASNPPSLLNNGIDIYVDGTSPGGELRVTVNYVYRFLVVPNFISRGMTIPLSSLTSMRLE